MFGILYPTQASDYDDLIIYPNPYKSRHSGLGVEGITFENLTENTNVSIYTIVGSLVWKAEDIDDNKVTWGLDNQSGMPVASGVYIYVITNDQNDKLSGKIAIIK